MSRCLTERSIDHVVLERGEVANSWKTERWDSLRLLTPNWQSRLPGCAYEYDDPDDFMTMLEVIGFMEHYAQVISAPVETHTTVTSVRRNDDGYRIETTRGSWQCRAVVLAAGACNIPNVPRVTEALPLFVETLTPMRYRKPTQLPEGGVLLVGASSTGLQLAHEIHSSGRPVTLAVGEHVRMPRVYRGKDILWWMDATGLLDVTWDEVDDIRRARNVPSPQLIGSYERATLDLNGLSKMGVKLVGRFAGVNGHNAQFSGSLPNVCALADLKMNRLLKTVDEWALEHDLDDAVGPVERFELTRLPASPPLSIDLGSGEIRTVIWATGFHPDYSWLDVPVLDRKGRIRHEAGVVDSPGMYLMGLNFLRRRKSSFIHGAGDDARDLSDHLLGYLDATG
jgi:putative flavoprotein involved in K+ transport